MKIYQALTAAEQFRGAEEAIARLPLGEQFIDEMAGAAQEYRRARRELLAMSAACGIDDPALKAAADAMEQARAAMKQAIKI
jgi:hypothetical protein